MNEYIQIANDNLMYHKSDGTVIKLLPTIEDIMSAGSVDRPRGEWIVSDKDSVCSVCGKDEAEFICGTEDWYGYGLSNYCPNCGARMKGADDE
jgi:hypothetical protein